MLQKLADHIADALERAAQAEQRAAAATDPAVKADFEYMARTWRQIAGSYQFAETLERFILDSEMAKRVFPRKPPAPN